MTTSIKHLVFVFNDNDFQLRFSTLGKMLYSVINDWGHNRNQIDIQSLFFDLLKTILKTTDTDYNKIYTHLTKTPNLYINNEAIDYLDNLRGNANHECLYINFEQSLENAIFII